MNNKLLFTVQMPDNGKPIMYARLVNEKYKNDQALAAAIIADWIEENDVLDATEAEISDLAYDMRHDGYAWWNEEVCFELTELKD